MFDDTKNIFENKTIAESPGQFEKYNAQDFLLQTLYSSFADPGKARSCPTKFFIIYSEIHWISPHWIPFLPQLYGPIKHKQLEMTISVIKVKANSNLKGHKQMHH